MKNFLMQLLPGWLVAFSAKKIEELTDVEIKAQRKYNDWLQTRRPLTDKKVIVAFVGLTGSGKSTVARYLANLIGASVVCTDDIRIELGKRGAGYEHTWMIAENIALGIVGDGRNVIIDSDFVDKNKRASLKQVAEKEGLQVIFIRIVCDFDIMSQRIRGNDPGEFFNFAKTKSTAKDHGKDVKFREMIRRLPLHYDWRNAGGGKLMLKQMGFVDFAPVDTGEEDWQKNARMIAENIIQKNKTDS